MFNDLISLWFRPTTFFATRFLQLDSYRLRILGFIGIVLGLGLGSFNTYVLSSYVIKEFSLRPDEYLGVIKNLGLDSSGFIKMLGLQKAYALVLGFLSPLIAFMAPHIFGGAVFAFLWLLMRGSDQKLDFLGVLDCASVALSSMIFYAIPAVGPLIALFMIGINLLKSAVYAASPQRIYENNGHSDGHVYLLFCNSRIFATARHSNGHMAQVLKKHSN